MDEDEPLVVDAGELFGDECLGPLAGLRNQVANLPRRDAAEVAVADELAALVEALTEAVGTCSVG